ncbi:MAG: type II secretion system major pseudopilin GspG [Candidatus Bathyarchaeia archaeon]
MKRIWKRREGFTLLEILIVVAIIGLLASLIVPNLIGRYEKSKEEIAKAQIEMLSSAIEAFRLDMGRYPNSLEELIKSTEPAWRGPYLAKTVIPKDPWGREYQYKFPGEHGSYDLYSLGPNGKLDERSITNWSR